MEKLYKDIIRQQRKELRFYKTAFYILLVAIVTGFLLYQIIYI